MLDYVYGQDKAVADFVAQLTPDVRLRGFPQASKAIGVIDDGRLVAGVVYHNFNPDAGVIEMSVGALPGKYWMTSETMRRVFDYPFLNIGCQLVLMLTPEENTRALRQLAAIGFTFTMLPRFWGRTKNGVLCSLTFEGWSSNHFNQRDHRRFATQQKEKAA